jgi:hypothetical protein
MPPDLSQVVLNSHQANLDRNTVYELIRGHGRNDIYLFYATTVGDFTRVVEHWILEEEWAKAIDIISRQVGLSPHLTRERCLTVRTLD